MENLSLMHRHGISEFTPVYDPTPMRAYSIHNMLTVMPFGDYGELLGRHDAPVGLLEALRRFAANLNISRSTLAALVCELMEVTHGYPERVAALVTLPEKNRANLIDIVHKMRQQLMPLCSE
jgi:serine/threonine-protein kinase HipA